MAPGSNGHGSPSYIGKLQRSHKSLVGERGNFNDCVYTLDEYKPPKKGFRLHPSCKQHLKRGERHKPIWIRVYESGGPTIMQIKALKNSGALVKANPDPVMKAICGFPEGKIHELGGCHNDMMTLPFCYVATKDNPSKIRRLTSPIKLDPIPEGYELHPAHKILDT